MTELLSNKPCQLFSDRQVPMKEDIATALNCSHHCVFPLGFRRRVWMLHRRKIDTHATMRRDRSGRTEEQNDHEYNHDAGETGCINFAEELWPSWTCGIYLLLIDIGIEFVVPLSFRAEKQQ
jgi:hypothetical protein